MKGREALSRTRWWFICSRLMAGSSGSVRAMGTGENAKLPGRQQFQNSLYPQRLTRDDLVLALHFGVYMQWSGAGKSQPRACRMYNTVRFSHVCWARSQMLSHTHLRCITSTTRNRSHFFPFTGEDPAAQSPRLDS